MEIIKKTIKRSSWAELKAAVEAGVNNSGCRDYDDASNPYGVAFGFSLI